MNDNATSLGVDPAHVAGGGPVTTVVQRAYATTVPVRLRLLLRPMLDDRTVLHAEARGRRGCTGASPAWIGVGDIDLFHA
ncbi:hypothetical protein [Streptomyces sp. R35]|uniref:Uncharacterized protein n=1 Tax=Streptomyces sp. R35 TaxID=3238630 RepID=A0AB39SN85_9ACTN